MRRLSLAALSVIAIFLPGLAGAQPVDIPDPNLQAAIRFELGIPTGPIDASDMLMLTGLDACCSGVVDLTGLEFATNLSWLYLDHNQIVDISPLAGLTNLTTLDLQNNQIVDVSPLAGLTNLTWLSLDRNQIVDIGPLTALPVIVNSTFLDLGYNQIVDISPLATLPNLQDLYLDHNLIVDLNPLAGLTNLSTLDLENNQIVDLNPLATLLNLLDLDLGDNQIVDLNPLAGLTNLTWLSLDRNQIVDLNPLATLLNLLDLHLGDNQIVDLNPLAGLTNLTWLSLDRNQIVDIQGLVSNTGLGTYDYVSLSNNLLSCTAINVDIPILQGRGVAVLYAVHACHDCRDNDSDGLIDLDDPDCTDPTDPFESPDADSYGAIVEEMAGGLRLRDPAECGGAPFLAFEAAASGSFHLVPGVAGSGEPGTVSFAVGLDSLTATEVRGNGARGVDPLTGRPTDRGAPPGASCTTGSEPVCWMAGEHPAINSNAFDAICGLTKGFTSLDLTACGQDIFNSQALTGPGAFDPLVMIAFTNILSGQPNPATGGAAAAEGLGGFTPTTIAELNAMAANPNTSILHFYSVTYGPNTPTVLVPLSADPSDGLPLTPPDLTPYGLNIPQVIAWSFTGLDRYLTDEQEALLGCGPFYGTRCDREGVALMRSELSALLQSFPRPEGACGSGGWDSTEPTLPQPGTAGFAGEPVCTRDVGGELHILPGCRSPGDPGYDPEVDGTLTGPDSTGTLYPEERRHPFTNQVWSSSMAVLSWNLLEGLVAFSRDADPGISIGEFDPDDPFRTDGCSFASPLGCSNVASMLSTTTLAPEEDSSPPPLRRWIWEVGGEYLVTEATGDLADFLGWSLFAFGPEQSRVVGADVGVLFFLAPPDPETAIPDSPLIVRHAGPDGDVGTADDNFAGIAYGVVAADCAHGIDTDGDGIADHCECGDISGDGFVNTIDARLIQRCAVGEDLPGICENPLCDATGEGECNTIDARLIQRLAVGELTKQDLHCAARP